MTETINLERRRGDSYADEFEITSETTGQPVDITGFTFLMTVDPEKAPVNSDNNIFQVAGNITDGPNGLVEFAPTAVQTDVLGSYFYDIQMTDTGGRIRTVIAGKYKLVQDITK